jgi:spermidine synthase
MGSIPMVMESQGFDQCHFTAIEIDETVIDLLTRYGLDKINAPIEVYEADAISYVAISQEKYDIITLDLFINDIIPDDVQSIEFLQNVKDSLAEDGILMMNHLSLTEVDQKKGAQFFKDIFKLVFPQADYIDVDGNWMLINDKVFIKS